MTGSEVGSAPNPSTALARVVVDELFRHGVRLAVLSPGSRSAALAYALAEQPSLALHTALDERSGGFFALGAAKAGSLTAVVTTSGTATANLYPAVVEADAAAVPLVVVTADRPPEFRHTGANQTIDQIHLYGPRVRWFASFGPGEDTPGEAGYWRSAVSQAVAAARGLYGRPGPVHLNISFREPVVPATDDGRTRGVPYQGRLEGRPGAEPWTSWVPSTPPPADFPVNGRVLVMLGEGSTPGLAEDAITAGAVVIAEAHSGARVPGTISTAHHLLAAGAVADSLRPSLVVQVGRVGLSPHVTAFLESAPERVVVASHQWPDPSRGAGAVSRPLRFVGGAFDPGWQRRWAEAEAVARQALDSALDQEPLPDEARTARDVAAAIPAGGALVVGSSMPVRDLDWFMAPRAGLEIVSNRGASGIDGFVSTALGVAVARPGPTVALSGDLGLLHDQNGWLTRPLPDLVLVVVNNNGGGIFSFLPQAGFPDHFEHLFATPHEIDLAAHARFFGVQYHQVVRADELTTEMTRRLSGGLHLLEVRTDRQSNVLRHRQLTSLVAEALTGW